MGNEKGKNGKTGSELDGKTDFLPLIPHSSSLIPFSCKLLLVVAVALFDEAGRVLLAQRPPQKDMAGLWEFPGGKVQEGETPEEALCRELKEELGIEVLPAHLSPLAFASHGYEKFHLLMPLYACRQWQGAVTPKEGQSIAWVPLSDLDKYAMPPADVPLVQLLRQT